MKKAHQVHFAVQDGICFGVTLSGNYFAEHSKPIDPISRALGCVESPHGIPLVKNREIAKHFTFGTFTRDGESHAILWMHQYRKHRTSLYTSNAAKRDWQFWCGGSSSFDQDSENNALASWDDKSFVICVRGDEYSRYLTTIYQGICSEDLSVSRDFVREAALPTALYGLNLTVPGLAPPNHIIALRPLLPDQAPAPTRH
ncbi:MAG: hypothetical protein FD131_3280 [Rhodocyclaceae bacterium]|nr:MAG: hypothetical protein FD131_3280 [Rhodocyclaceae bacterium]